MEGISDLQKLKQNIASPWKFRTYIKYKKIQEFRDTHS
jgi:hypothetical protein